MKMKEKSNWKLMAKVIGHYENATQEATKEAADAMVDDIQTHWGVDGAPDKDSGNLDSAIRSSSHGRDDSGRFSAKSTASYYVTANAPDGDSYHGRGNYSIPLEEGWSGPQGSAPPYPFIRQSIERLSAVFPAIIERKLK